MTVDEFDEFVAWFAWRVEALTLRMADRRLPVPVLDAWENWRP